MELKMRINKTISSPQILGTYDVSDESKIRFVIENAGPSNVIVVRARITGQSSFTAIKTIIGAVSEVVNVFTYEEVQVECTTFDSTSNIVTILASSFNEAGGSAIESIGVPSGDTLTDIESLTLTSSDNSISIVGDNVTKSIDFTTDVASLSYTPDDATDWSPSPTTIVEGLDQLADRTKTIELDLPNKIDSSEKGAPSGVAPLNASSKIDSTYLPSYVDDVVEVPNYLALPVIGESGKIYLTLDNNKIYRWSGSTYIEIAENKAVWGNITGTLSNQTDLQDALDDKVYKAGDTMTGPLNMSALSENIQFSIYGLNATQGIEIRSDDDATRPTGNVKLTTGDASGSDSAGSIYLEGGSNVDGNPANINIIAGQSSGTGVNGSITLDSKQVVYLNQNPAGYIDAVNHHIQNVLDPISPQDAATKKWVEDISSITGVLIVDSSASIFGADGSLLRPFVTIADAVAAASDGTVIRILPGSYSEPQVVIPSSLKSLTFTGESQSSTSINNGISYTAPADSIDFLFEKLNIGQVTIDATSALNGLITIKQSSFSINRLDSNSGVFCTVSESTAFGGSSYGNSSFSECLILANIDIYSQLFIFENCKFISSCTLYGSSTARILDCELFGATEFINGVIVMGNTPNIEIDTASDYLGTITGAYTKTLLATIPLSNLGESGASVNQVPIFNGTSWYPDNVSASDVTYAPIVPSDWDIPPVTAAEGLDELASRVTTVEDITIEINDVFSDTHEPTGFLNRTDSLISFSDITREFTIQPTVTSFEFYIKGVKYIRSAPESITIPNTDGNHYIYYNENGDLDSTTVFTSAIIEQFAFVAVVYWNSSTSSHTYFAEERHGITMDGVSHAYLHTVFGARYLSGLALQGFSVDGSGNLAAHAQFTADTGSLRDEDILHILPAALQIPILYRQGSLWRKKPANSYPVIYNGTAGYTGANGRLPYNQFIAGNWQLTEISNSSYVLVHFFGTNDIDNPIVGIHGINEYNSIAAARLGANAEITSLAGLPFAEFVAIGSVIFESATGYGNIPKARVVSTDLGASYVDFRGTQLYTPAGEATTHGLLSGLGNDDHPQYHTDARGDIRYYTKTQIDSTVTGLQSDINTRAFDVDVIKKNGTVAFTGNQSMGGNKLTNVANPIALTDAVNLQTLNTALGSSNDITEKSFSISSNQSIAANVTDFVFSNATIRSFDAIVSVYINATTSLYETFEVRGIQKALDWVISISSEGDNSGIILSINSSGQMQYTSTSYSGFVSGTMKFRAITTSV